MSRINKAGATLLKGEQGQKLMPTACKDLTSSMLLHSLDQGSPSGELHTDLRNIIASLNSYKGIIRNSTDLIFERHHSDLLKFTNIWNS